MGVMLCLQRKMAMIHMDLCLFTNKQMALGAAAIYHLRALTACHVRHLTRVRSMHALEGRAATTAAKAPARPEPQPLQEHAPDLPRARPWPIWSHHDRPSVRHRDSRCKLL
jgi:hypothetical protein